MHDNGTQTIKAEVVEPIVEAQETCREEANTSSSYSPSPRTVYTCNDGKVSLSGIKDVFVQFQHPFLETKYDFTFSSIFVLSSRITSVSLLPNLPYVFVMFHSV